LTAFTSTAKVQGIVLVVGDKASRHDDDDNNKTVLFCAVAQLRATNNKVTNLAEMAKCAGWAKKKTFCYDAVFTRKLRLYGRIVGTDRSPVGPSRGAESPASDGVSPSILLVSYGAPISQLATPNTFASYSGT
jgi:hypothetical protein